ncbi:transcription antitermination protein [Halobellus captivus]|uniref:transcription antitermination protein n=1 Tax=Halobellus captivus TaxID=2592614 RepID=UPI0011A1D1CD|nr:transcription antitermination protein [Halobellus captivus]
MNGSDLTAELQDEHETAFSRLGSSKAMYAVTGGEMDGDSIRAAAASDALALADVLESWAESDGGGGDGEADLFADLASAARDRAADVADDPSDGDGPSRYEALATFESIPARLGGLLGRYLVALEHAGQMVGFFIGDADPMAADDFRGYRSELEAERDRVLAALDGACDSDDDWKAAREAADAVVEAAYDDYVKTLESMGIKPKNVC